MREIGRVSNFKETVLFECPSHTNSLLHGLNGLRKKGLLLDVTLVASGQSFEAHRAVLASCSDYFRAMFCTNEMKESQQKEIHLNGVTGEGMRYLLEYAYTSRLALSLANIQDVLSAANHVQLMDVVEACASYLQDQMDLDNCVDVVTIAETYCLTSLKKKVYRLMCSNLMQFSRTLEFQRLSVYQFSQVLESNFPVDCSESIVLGIVMKWINFRYSERVAFASHLLKHINLKEVKSEDLLHHHSAIKAMLNDPSVQTKSSLNFAFSKRILSKCQSYKEPPNVLVNTRGMELALVKVGGFTGVGGVTNEITYYLSGSGKWKYLTSIPHVKQCNFGVTVFHNDLVIAGGCFDQSLQENVHPFGFRYNPLTNTWSTISPMQRERCRFSLCVVDNFVYALGGVGETDDPSQVEAPSEMYDPVTDLWAPMTPIPGGSRAQHAAVSWRNFIFVSGGLDQDMVLDSMVRYNTLTDTWETKTPMLLPRADHSMVCFEDKLFLCGGWYEDEATGMRVLADSVDVYDVAQDMWKPNLTKIPTPRYHTGITINGSLLIVMGGFHSDNTFDRACGVIEYYDIVTGTWCSGTSYPQDIWEFSTTTLYLPTCRDDLEVISDKDS